MARKKLELALPTVDDLFTSQGEREQDAGEKVREIALEAIEAFPGHPFKVADDEDMARLAESIAESGARRRDRRARHRAVRGQVHGRRRGHDSHGGLEPSEGDHPAERAGVRLFDAA